MNPVLSVWNIIATYVFLPTDLIIQWVSDIFNMTMDILLHLPQYAMEFLTVNAKPILQITILPGLAWVIVYAIIAVWFERKFLARAMLRVVLLGDAGASPVGSCPGGHPDSL